MNADRDCANLNIAEGASDEDIAVNHAFFSERMALYKRYGFDQEEARRRFVNQVSEHNKSVLEIGTGRGYCTVMLARSFDRIVSVGLDGNEHRTAMLNAAYYGLLHKIEFVTADAGKLGYPDKSFDAVVSAFTFHHLDFLFKVMREMMRIADRQIVVSDFTEKGFDAVERVHRFEGRTHERKPGDFSIVGAYMKEFNFDVSVVEDEWQILYSARRKNSD
jgi:ubiquinone/menaquinone biosynthesis C-methylase UbiE